MPYDHNNPPDKLKGLSDSDKEKWVKVFNSAYDTYDGDEGKAHATAWSAVNKDKKSSSRSLFIRLSNLKDGEQKKELIDYYKKIWGKDYAKKLTENYESGKRTESK